MTGLTINGQDLPLRALSIADIKAMKPSLKAAQGFTPFASDDVLDAVVDLVHHQAPENTSRDAIAAAITVENFPAIWSQILGVPVIRKEAPAPGEPKAGQGTA